MHSRHQLCIIVTVFERQNKINSLLNDLFKQSHKEFQLIVVDHGNKKLALPELPWITHLRESSELWWTGAINQGIRHALSKIEPTVNIPILILNDDVSVEPNYLTALMDVWMLDNESMVGSVCIDSENRLIVHAHLSLMRFKATLKYHSKGLPPKSLMKDKYPSHTLKGRGTIIPSTIFRDVGLYDEKHLPHYRADHELVIRARKSGYCAFVAAKAIVKSKLDSSQHGIERKNVISSLRKTYFNTKSIKNIPDLFYYSFLCYGFIYGTYFLFTNLTRELASLIREIIGGR